ncbi:DNA (cytosine-5)-methyltransferase 1 [Neobacillus niacini]|uniref:DNA cytosine methyltransferase n=1 Tax=Neobacillus niacini TaxID=86668 RepID=UPI00285737B4|nr:DNA cytosine methyltransferase [Neobacillus niacini]MDR7079883.1 DNA (cytosine-5)-methyltransferase 1 [Neobacillus niacini]
MNAKNRIKGLSLFSGGGIAETYFKDIGIDIVVANELLAQRADFYSKTHPDTKMIQGDITDPKVFDSVISEAMEQDIRFLIATPPCQGMSTLGKKQYELDERNSLINYAVDAINILKPDYVLIENVPKFFKLFYPLNGELVSIEELLNNQFSTEYNIELDVLNAMNFGVPQSRPRAIIKMYKHHLTWSWPTKENKLITLREAIGHLPSLKAGETSSIKWHRALNHSEMQVEAMSHTSEGKSAMKNPIYYPKKKDGTPVKGFHNTYKRMKWDEPCPARATNNHLISGHNNVHPGRLLPNGTWSDPRVLTFLELIIVSSLPLDWNIPEDINENFIRQIIGEAIPPLLSKVIVKGIKELEFNSEHV